MTCTICGVPEEHHDGGQCVEFLLARLAEAERRISELQSEVDCEERRFNAQYDLLAEVSKRADDLAARLAKTERRAEETTIIANGCRNAGLVYSPGDGCLPCFDMVKYEQFESRLSESEGREAVLVRVLKEISMRGTEEGGCYYRNIASIEDARKCLKSIPARTAAVLAVLDAALAFHDVPTNNEKAERFSKACHKYKEV